MRTPRGKLVAWCSVTMGVVVLAVCGFVFRRAIVEEWYIHKLRSGDEEERRAAAEKLGKMGSVRAVPHIFQAIVNRDVEFDLRIGGSPISDSMTLVLSEHPGKDVVYVGALGQIAYFRRSAAVPYFLRSLTHENNQIRRLSAFLLGTPGPQAKRAVPALRKALQDSDREVAKIAGWALESIQTGEPLWQGEAGDEEHEIQ